MELAENGETVVIARNGNPIVELVLMKRTIGFPLGIAKNDPVAPAGDEWRAQPDLRYEGAAGPLGVPVQNGAREYPVASSACGIPLSAKAG